MSSKDYSTLEYNRGLLIRKRTSILDEKCSNYEQMLHPVKSPAWKIRQCSSKDLLVQKQALRNMSFVVPFPNHLDKCCCGSGIQQYSTRLRLSVSLHILFPH